MDPTLAVARINSFAGIGWTWTAAFAPRLLAAVVIVIGGLLLSYWLRRMVRPRHPITAARSDARTGAAGGHPLQLCDPDRAPRPQPARHPDDASLLAVLGAAGLALGLALQGTLSNIAALERFQQKWIHFCASETRQNKDLEPMF